MSRRRPARGLAVAFPVAALLLSGCGGESPPSAENGASTTRLAGAFDSAEAAAERALALIEAGDADGLGEIALSEAEFRELVYPELPASRPERNTSADFVWGSLRQKSSNALAFTLDRYAGKRLELLALDFLGETTDYGSYRVHRESALTVRGEDGERVVLHLFGSVIERGGRYKIFSFVTD